MRARHGSAPAAVRLAALALVTAAILPVHCLWRAPAPSPTSRLAMRCAARLLRLRFRREGTPAAGPVLYVANHVSWADIVVLAAALDASFVAKAEVAGWPALGWLSRRHGTLFVDRERRATVRGQRDALRARLASGGSLILFAEGTSSDGTGVLPFKPALFAAAMAEGVPVQAVTILWERVGGAAVDDGNRLRIAWIDDMTLLPHVWQLVKSGGAEARLIFHAPVGPAEFGSRAELAQHCRDQVAGPLRPPS